MITPFGKAVRKARIDLGVTMAEMAEEIGYSTTYLSMLETGKKDVNDSALDNILQYLSSKEACIDDLIYLSRISNKSILNKTAKNRELMALVSITHLTKLQIIAIKEIIEGTK